MQESVIDATHSHICHPTSEVVFGAMFLAVPYTMAINSGTVHDNLVFNYVISKKNW